MPVQLTSVLAEPSLFDKVTQRQRILALLSRLQQGATDEEIQDALHMEGSTERPRRGELLTMGLIEDSLSRRKTKKGRWAIIWQIRKNTDAA